MKQIIVFLSSMLILASCSTSRQTSLTGVDRDKHGCLPSAGYTWSEVRKDCIKVFETGIRLNNVANPNATASAFAVLAPDSSVAELFLPDSSEHPRLQKYSGGWKNKSFELKRDDNKLLLYKKGKLVYQE